LNDAGDGPSYYWSDFMKSSRFVLSVFVASLALSSISRAGQLGPHLTTHIDNRSSIELVKVWIELKDNYDSRALKQSVTASAATRAERHALTLSELKRRSKDQDDLLNNLGQLQSQNRARNVKGHWIVNVVEAEIAVGDLENLARRADVETIYLQPEMLTSWAGTAPVV
jgi:hypothetical protein